MTKYVFDVEWYVEEGQDVVLDAKYIHCAVFKELGKYGSFYEFTKDNMHSLKEWILNNYDCTYIGHNILTSDLEVFRRLLDIDFTVGPDTIAGKPCTFIDTFTMSKRNNPDRTPFYYKGKSLGIHGLDAWGGRVGIPKPKVTDWTKQPIEVYLNRCREDVKINEATYLMLFEEMMG